MSGETEPVTDAGADDKASGGVGSLSSLEPGGGWGARQNRVLVADTDSGFTSYVEEFCSRLGCGAAVARDLDAFQTANAEYEPELIFLNLTLGDRDAVEILRYLSERRSRAQVVLMGGADLKVLEAAERLGRSRRLSMLPSLEKPVSAADLRSILKSVVNARPEIGEDELREGLDKSQFVPFFQPVVDLIGQEGRILRAEVLARWDHPFHGMLPAAEFIEAVDRNGFMLELTEVLLSRSLKYAGRCRENGLMLPVSVNVSASSMTDLMLPERLTEIVTGHGFQNEAVMIELTETSMIEDRLEILEVLTRLRMKGFGLAMDDFGTGYSTLLELVRLPFNEIKIDQRFVEKLEIRRESDIVVGTTVGLAHGLGMTVCAEGVESQKSLDFLRKSGCDAAQGRFIQEPVPGDELMECLGHWGRGGQVRPSPAVVGRSRQERSDPALL